MSIYISMMQKSFSSNPRKVKVLKKIGSRMRVGRKALDCFNDLAEKMENGDDALYKLNSVYAFLDNGRRVVGSGKGLSDCFVGWLPPEQIVLIKTGEETGRIAEAIDQCIALDQQVSLIKKTIKKAAFMPSIASMLLLGVLVATYQKGIPMLLEIAPMEDWGSTPLQLLALTETFGADPIKTLVITISTIIAFAWAIPNLDIKGNPQFRNKLDKYAPFFGIYQTMQASIFLRSLATLLSSGVRVKDALELIVLNSPKYVANRVAEMRDKISSGGELGDCFVNPFLGENGRDLADMSQGNALEQALEEVATETMNEVLESLPAKLNILGKVMIASCLGVILFAMGAFYEIVGSLT
ncbi:type II secretion system F family protein [Vibrio coralliirubri]|uniref:type II secretion system F family protein n=1 Tax=Vibrio coralliirubri TaxID=1516159 RepID=UPI002284944C|nr:type II secretion system F family protein [Vibrio coralliirubri]MCY9866114.1 type II secretion system F family protein [Vibrio coralliirubri]